MKSTATRLSVWITLALVATVGLCPRVVPALDATLMGVAAVCAPANAGALSQRVPRCGVA
jgi:hypothetical protein